MRILSLDEVPDEWKKGLTQSGNDRYVLFREEIQSKIPGIQASSVRGVVGILETLDKKDFPYEALKINKSGKNFGKYLNRGCHMGVMVEDDSGTFFLKGLLDNESVQYGELSAFDISL